ncbi:MAG: hypothetical protein ACJ763_01380 [Bdellovibrionia bacterium]
MSGTSGSASGNCTPTKAQLVIYDNFIQNLCGCQEAPGIVQPPVSLTCTVSAGTQIIFWYLNTTEFHQIQSTAQPTFPTSPLSDPGSLNTVRAHVVTLTDPGSYEFEDVYNHTINGTIIVQ